MKRQGMQKRGLVRPRQRFPRNSMLEAGFNPAATHTRGVEEVTCLRTSSSDDSAQPDVADLGFQAPGQQHVGAFDVQVDN